VVHRAIGRLRRHLHSATYRYNAAAKHVRTSSGRAVPAFLATNQGYVAGTRVGCPPRFTRAGDPTTQTPCGSTRRTAVHREIQAGEPRGRIAISLELAQFSGRRYPGICSKQPTPADRFLFMRSSRTFYGSWHFPRPLSG